MYYTRHRGSSLSVSLSLCHTAFSFCFPFFFLLRRRNGRAHDEKRSLARRVHQSLRVPATTACRLPWRRTRASAKVRPHWVKAKASWWGSRLARQSMRAVLVPPSDATRPHYRSFFLALVPPLLATPASHLSRPSSLSIRRATAGTVLFSSRSFPRRVSLPRTRVS